MIYTENYIILESLGYESKSDAYLHILLLYNDMKGVTTYYDKGMWYIVQDKSLI